jgi:hypothetical protein
MGRVLRMKKAGISGCPVLGVVAIGSNPVGICIIVVPGVDYGVQSGDWFRSTCS